MYMNMYVCLGMEFCYCGKDNATHTHSHTHTHSGTQSAMQPKPNRAENEMENIAMRSSEIKKK